MAFSMVFILGGIAVVAVIVGITIAVIKNHLD